jgi:hypothetical protein
MLMFNSKGSDIRRVVVDVVMSASSRAWPACARGSFCLVMSIDDELGGLTPTGQKAIDGGMIMRDTAKPGSLDLEVEYTFQYPLTLTLLAGLVGIIRR